MVAAQPNRSLLAALRSAAGSRARPLQKIRATRCVVSGGAPAPAGMNHLHTLRLAPTALLLAASLAAQSVVFPSTHATITNGASSIDWFPLSSGISRQQIVYEAWDLNIPANTPITRIGFRHDPSYSSVARQVQMEVRVGSTLATSTNIGTNFDGNFAGTPTTVFPTGLFTLPAFTTQTGGTFFINFTTPYVYTGGNLLVEFRVFANNNGNQSFSYGIDRALYVSPVTNGVAGCQHSGNQTPSLQHYPTAIGANWQIALNSAPANTPIALFVAAGQPMSTPYSLANIGLQPTCFGQLPLTGLSSFGSTTGSSGNASWNVPVPNNLALNNFVISAQVVAIDFFSPGTLVVSNASQVQFGVNPAASIVYSTGSATATTGSVYTSYCPVTFFN